MNRLFSYVCIGLLPLCLGAVPSAGVEYAETFMAGMSLTVEEAAALEERLADEAHDLRARSELVVYHHSKAFRDPVSRHRHTGHVLWLIRNAPLASILATPHVQIHPHIDPDGYNAGMQAWTNQLDQEPTNVAFLRHAASFYSEHQDGDLVIAALQKGQSLDANDSWWPTQLGHVYLRAATYAGQIGGAIKLPDSLDADDPRLPSGLAQLLAGSGPGEETNALLALGQFQRAYELAGSESERGSLLEGLATAAFRAERYEDARLHAVALLGSTPGTRAAERHIHKANIILGQVALVGDDVALASHHLLEAGKVSGEATLGSFGPNMRLAADLLERGETDVVLEYFELCSNFWPNEKLKDWAALVKGGRTPDFGANLVY